MRRDLAPEDLGDLLERPLVAVLATYRRDATVLLSPVWHEWRQGGFTIITGSGDIKARHLRADSSASVLVYEHEPPYRGVEVRGRATLERDAHETVRRIAVRYLGEAAGAEYAERSVDDLLIRLAPGELRAWDFTDEFG